MALSEDAKKKNRENMAIWAEREKIKMELAARHGLRESDAGQNLDFLDRKRSYDGKGYPHWLDHISFWNKGGKPYAVVGQPYSLSGEDMADILKNCNERGLEFCLKTWPAWHYPGHVLFIEFRKKENW